MVEPLVKVDLTDHVTLKCDTGTATEGPISYKVYIGSRPHKRWG